MPNRYEREIEEILRNLEQPGPTGQKFGDRFRRKPGVRMRQPRFSLRLPSLSLQERLLLTAVIAALIAGGYAYLTGQSDLFTLVLSFVAIVCIILVACSYYLFQPRPSQSARYRNVPPTIVITPLRRNPLNVLKTQWNLFKLRMRYRRKNER
jgi:hypothetical protein